MIGFTIGAIGSAANIWAYAEYGNPLNLAVAAFCALVAICSAVMAS